MSFKAMAWATEQEVTTTSTQSHLLLILASFANEVGECYPSISTMMAKTRLAEKTVRKCLKELMELGLICDTKKTAYFGAKIYKLSMETPSKSDTPSKNAGGGNSTSTPLVDLPQGGGNFTADPLVNLPPNPVIEPVKEPIIEPVIINTHENTQQIFEKLKNSSQTKTTAKKFITAEDLIQLGVNSQVANDFIATRKTKLTQTALSGIAKQATQANITLGDAIEIAVENGWQSFKADWYHNQRQPNNAWKKPNRMAEFAQQASQWGDDFYSQQTSLGASK